MLDSIPEGSDGKVLSSVAAVWSYEAGHVVFSDTDITQNRFHRSVPCGSAHEGKGSEHLGVLSLFWAQYGNQGTNEYIVVKLNLGLSYNK